MCQHIPSKFHFRPEDTGLLPPVPRSRPTTPATPLEVLLMAAEALVAGQPLMIRAIWQGQSFFGWDFNHQNVEKYQWICLIDDGFIVRLVR